MSITMHLMGLTRWAYNPFSNRERTRMNSKAIMASKSMHTMEMYRGKCYLLALSGESSLNYVGSVFGTMPRLFFFCSSCSFYSYAASSYCFNSLAACFFCCSAASTILSCSFFIICSVRAFSSLYSFCFSYALMSSSYFCMACSNSLSSSELFVISISFGSKSPRD